MSNARIYITILLLLGVAALLMGSFEWKPDQLIRFACFLSVAVGMAAFGARVPGAAGQTSFTVLFILLGVAELTLPEVLWIGCAASVVDSLTRASRANLLEVYFSVANTTIAAAVAYRSATIAGSAGLTEVLQLAVATFALFLAETFPLAAVSALRTNESVVKVWRSEQWPNVFHYATAGVLACGFQLLSGVAGWPAALTAIPAVCLLYRTYRMHRARVDDEEDHAAELEALQMRTIEALALAIEAKDTTTSDHLRRVQVYAVEIGRILGMNDDELHALRAASILHDIGKLAVPEYIISKPGRLTPAEFEKMKIHPVIGAEILEHVQFPYPVVPIVRAHHEKWNGAGYPYGIAGEEIPLGARILAAVDTFDALASDRQYRRALPIAEAMAKVKEESGRSFDPQVVEVLEKHYPELEQQAQQATGITLKLSIDLKITNGQAPGAGFEHTAGVNVGVHEKYPEDPLACMAAVRNDLRGLLDRGVDSRSLMLDEFCPLLAVRLRRALPFETLVLWIVRDDFLIPVSVQGHDSRYFASLEIPVGQGLSGWVVENRKPIVNGNPSVEAGYLNNPSVYSTLQAALAIPLENADGVFGVLSLYQDARDGFSRDHLRVLQSLGPRLSSAILEIAPRRDVFVIEKRATDSLSILRNIEAELARSRRLNLPLGVVICSLEGSRSSSVADTEVAMRTMMGVMREGSHDHESLARLSELEMVLTVPGATRESMRTRAARLMRTPFTSGNFYVAAGAAGYPDDGATSEQLLAAAEREVLISRTELAARLAAGKSSVASAPWVQ